jgi:hypothetical protein
MHRALPASFRPKLQEATLWTDPLFADAFWADVLKPVLLFSLSLRVEDPPWRERAGVRVNRWKIGRPHPTLSQRERVFELRLSPR